MNFGEFSTTVLWTANNHDAHGVTLSQGVRPDQSSSTARVAQSFVGAGGD
jgi:hypothetical protein